MINVGNFSVWPIRRLRDAVELRRLRKQLGNPHRWMMSKPDGLRLETDAEYLERLRGLALIWAAPDRAADSSSEHKLSRG